MKDESPLSREEAEPHLTPLIPIVLESFWDAWKFKDELLGNHPLALTAVKSPTVAGIVSDAFGYFAFPRLAARSDTRSRQIGRSQLAVIKESVLLRFKKLTLDLQSMSIHTDQQRDISHHQETLPNGRRLTTVTLGYTQTLLTPSKPTGIYFTCPNGWNKNYWVWPIYQADDGQLGMFDDNPINPIDSNDVNEVLNVDIRVKKRKGKHG